MLSTYLQNKKKSRLKMSKNNLKVKKCLTPREFFEKLYGQTNSKSNIVSNNNDRNIANYNNDQCSRKSPLEAKDERLNEIGNESDEPIDIDEDTEDIQHSPRKQDLTPKEHSHTSTRTNDEIERKLIKIPESIRHDISSKNKTSTPIDEDSSLENQQIAVDGSHRSSQIHDNRSQTENSCHRTQKTKGDHSLENRQEKIVKNDIQDKAHHKSFTTTNPTAEKIPTGLFSGGKSKAICRGPVVSKNGPNQMVPRPPGTAVFNFHPHGSYFNPPHLFPTTVGQLPIALSAFRKYD